jgi:type I restriction enzyme S subunit
MTLKENILIDYKSTKLGWIPDDWTITPLVKMSKIERGRFSPRPRNDPKYYNGKIPFVQTSDVSQSSGVVRSHTQTLNGEGLKVSKLFKKGTILITIASNIGHAAILDYDMACPDSLIGLSVKDGFSNDYLNYYLRARQRRMEYDAPGAQKNINVEFLQPYPIITPPLPEQHAIAKVLGSMDKAINANNQLIAQKELRKKWLMQNLLTGKKRLKGFSGEWKEYHLGELFAERNERNTDELPLLSIGQNGVYPQEDSIKKDTSNSDKSKYKKICVGDIGYNTMRMWQGRSALSALEGIVSPAYTILKPRKNADALFFSYLFKTPKMVNLFWRNSQGLVGDTLNCKYKDFSIVKATLPLKDEQTAIAKILQAADKELDILKAKTDKLKEQKKGMMQVLLTGKKRLKIKTV